MDDAVKSLIATKKSKDITVADVVQYDKCFKLYSWYDRQKMVNRGHSADDFCAFGFVCGILHYVKVSEMTKLPEAHRALVRRLIKANKNPDGSWKYD